MQPPHELPSRAASVAAPQNRPTAPRCRRAGALGLLLVLAALPTLVACGARDGGPARPKNVVLFLVDTLRADRLGCYGYGRDTSPHLDALAERGTLYTENRAQACWTVPSMISLMSGLYVAQRETRAPETPLLAERLREAGLATAAFIGNATLVHDRGFQRGFGTFEVTRGTGQADELVRLFERWHRGRAESDERGYFAWIHPIDPHHPYSPSAEHHVFRGEREEEARLHALWEAGQSSAEKWAAPETPLPLDAATAKIRALSNRYDGEVLAADAALGRLLDYLDRAGELEETLIVFASDHGEKLWEHERYEAELLYRRESRGPLAEGVVETFGCGHRAWFHEELWRTPLVFAGPGFPAGARVDGLAANLDIQPTLLDALGLEVEPTAPLSGESLLGGKVPTRERVFAYGFDTTASIDRDGRKLIEHSVSNFGEARGPEPAELFDLGTDPFEQHDVALRDPATLEELRAIHHAWRTEHGREVDTSESEAALDALRQLGYLDDEEAADGGAKDGQ